MTTTTLPAGSTRPRYHALDADDTAGRPCLLVLDTDGADVLVATFGRPRPDRGPARPTVDAGDLVWATWATDPAPRLTVIDETADDGDGGQQLVGTWLDADTRQPLASGICFTTAHIYDVEVPDDAA